MADDDRPTMLCYLCCAELRHCNKFFQAARRAQTLLTQFIQSGASFIDTSVNPVHNYTITPIENVSLSNDSDEFQEDQIKKETNNFDDKKSELVQIELTPVIKTEPDEEHFGADCVTSDSEDDVPLKALKTEIKLKKYQRRKYLKKMKLDAREVNPTKEQQIQNVLARANSLNYLNSPFKCDLCYKGFVSAIAYKNHNVKHNERSGPHECSICQLRYLTPRLLRAHVRAAHDRLYSCNRCDHISHTAYQASDHEKWHDGHIYDCQLCGRKFKKRTSYLTHLRKNHATHHICDMCGDGFVGAHGLLMHKNKAHSRTHEIIEDGTERSERFCSTCNIQFVTKDAWQWHILNSIKHALKPDESKQCPICSRTIPENESLSHHLKVHQNKLKKPRPPITIIANSVRAKVACDQCGASFPYKSQLQAHIKRTHLGIKYNKNVVCEVCGKKWTSNAALKYHQRTHTGERPFACSACHKRFTDSNQLRIHRRVHTGEKPYACDHCERRFTQKPALNRHYRVHTGAKPYACQFCSKSFSQSNSLKVHVKAVHEKIPYRKQKAVEKPTDNIIVKCSPD